ncbi:MAG: hypothetical protein R3Y43_03455 [Alphaproteobacteria bacterium]
MNLSKINVFALPTINVGYQNQIIGAINAISNFIGQTWDVNKLFLTPKNIRNISELKEDVKYSNYSSYKEFAEDMFLMIDAYLKKTKNIPNIFITVYNQADNENAPRNIKMACRAVKEYYKKNNLGFVLCCVLTSNFHKYRYVDLINIPKHNLNLINRLRLVSDKKLRKKVLITKGIINNFNIETVVKKKKELTTLLKQNNTKNIIINNSLEKLANFTKKSKRIVFCLGGRVDGPEIDFNLKYIQKLLKDAIKLEKLGYSIVFVNGHRTPNNITDFLYKKTKDMPNITFQNSKPIAKNKDERKKENWRIYSGKYEKELSELATIGNIYPAVLGFENTLVVHTADSYASCETSNAAIPTAISSKGLYINPEKRPDCLRLKNILCPVFAIDWDDFLKKTTTESIEPKDISTKVLPGSLRVFAEQVINKLNQNDKQKHLKSKNL